MNSVGNKYELAIQNVKAAFLDDVYRNQGMVTVVSGKMDTYTEEQKSTLTDLIAKQTEKVESILTSIDGLNAAISELNEIGSKIQGITAGSLVNEADVSNEMVSEAVAGGELELPGVVAQATEETANIAESTQAPVEGELTIPGVVTENNNVPVAGNDGQATADVVEIPAVVSAPVAEAAPPAAAPAEEQVVAEAEPTTAATVEGQVVAEVAPPAATPAEEQVVAEAASPAAVPVEEQVVAEAAPINETVTIAGSSGALEDSSVATETLAAPFALSPIDEDVTPATAVEENSSQAAAQTAPAASPESVAAAIIPDTVAVEENASVAESVSAVGQVAEVAPVAENTANNIIKFNRLAGGQTKAILVTGQQYAKLAASRETQTALMSAKNALPSTSDLNAPAANGQTLVANGGVEVTEEDKSKQMEAMLNQANTLYQQGNTAEAQAIYNQVSSMNQEIQANTTSDANVLVKAA